MINLDHITGNHFAALTSPSMEAMIIVGLCLGSFSHGQTHDMSLQMFIEKIDSISRFIGGRRQAMLPNAKSSLRDQSKIYLTNNWKILRYMFEQNLPSNQQHIRFGFW